MPDERMRHSIELPPPDDDGIDVAGPYERFIAWAAGLPWWAIILSVVVVVVVYSMLTSAAYRRVIKDLTDKPQVSTDDLFSAVLLVGNERTVVGMLAEADSVETVIQQLIEEVHPEEAKDFGILAAESETEFTLLTEGGPVTIAKRNIVKESRTETSDGIQVQVTYYANAHIVTGTVTKQTDSSLTIRTVNQESETFAVSRILDREILPCTEADGPNCVEGDKVTIQRQGEIITGTLDTLNNTSIKVRVHGESDVREVRRSEIEDLHLPTLTLAVHQPAAEQTVKTDAELRFAYVVGADLTKLLEELNQLDAVGVPLLSSLGEAQVALVGYATVSEALEATSLGEVDGLIYLAGGPDRLAVQEWVDANPARDVAIVAVQECAKNCRVTLKLNDDDITGRVSEENASTITIVTTEAEFVRVNKANILEERRMDPAGCALNNLRGCDAGIFLTIRVTFLAYALAVLIGLLVGLMRVQHNPVLYAASTLYVEVMRGIPLLVILLYAGFVVSPWIRDNLGVNLSDEQEAILGLAIGYGAFIAEIFRAGIQSIGRGQMEAARSLGMSYPQAMRYVVLPQAVRVVLPPLGNDFIAMLKDSALISVLALPDLLQLGRLFVSRTFRAFEGYNTVAVLYLMMTIFLSMMVRIIERRTRLPQ